MRRLACLLALVLVALASLVAQPALANPDSEAGFLRAADDARARTGMAPLRQVPDLVEVARRHARRMADGDRIYHNPNLRAEVHGWRAVGENVGRGSSVDYVHRLLMDSQQHRGNILSARFTEVGMGVLWKGSTLYVVQVFREPASQQAVAPRPQPAPPPAPAPAPSPKVASRTAPPPSPPPPPAPVAVAPQPVAAEMPELALAVAPAVGDAGAAVSQPGLDPALVAGTAQPTTGPAVFVAAALVVIVLSAQLRMVRRQLAVRSVAW